MADKLAQHPNHTQGGCFVFQPAKMPIAVPRFQRRSGAINALEEALARPATVTLPKRRLAPLRIFSSFIHQERIVSWLTSMPRSCSRFSTFRSESGNRPYIITARRMISDGVFNWRDGLEQLIAERRAMSLSAHAGLL